MKVERTESKICVSSPYNPDLPKPARALGGKWNPTKNAWCFDRRDESRVEELYRRIYGEWDTNDVPPADAVTCRVKLLKDIRVVHGGIFFAGRQIARATGRDSGATLASGVILIAGKGFASGGSVKNWATTGEEGTVFELRDVPLSKVKEEMENEDNAERYEITILGDVDTAALETEKQRLLARIAEIDAILAAQ